LKVCDLNFGYQESNEQLSTSLQEMFIKSIFCASTSSVLFEVMFTYLFNKKKVNRLKNIFCYSFKTFFFFFIDFFAVKKYFTIKYPQN
jgi:hypothetical protein